MDYPAIMMCKNIECSKVWYVESDGNEQWHLTSWETYYEREPKPLSVEQVKQLITTGDINQLEWQTTIRRRIWNVAASEPICPECGADVEETFVMRIE